MLSKRTSRAYAAETETAPGFWMIGILWRMLATGMQTGNSMCLLDQSCPVGSGPTQHAHDQEEGLYVAKGKVSFQAGGKAFEANAGCFVAVPRRTEHSFVVVDEAILINFYFPAGFDAWLMGSAVPAKSNELPPKDLAPPVYHLTKRLSDDYGGLPLTQKRSTSANPNAPALPAVTSPQTADNFSFGGGCWSVLADAGSTGGSYSLFEVEMSQGLAEQPHIHDHTDEAYYVFSGELDFLVDDRVLRLQKGSFVFVPRGSVHTFTVISNSARFLNIHTEPGYERVIRAFGKKIQGPTTPTKTGRQQKDPLSDGLLEIYADIGFRSIVLPAGFQK